MLCCYIKYQFINQNKLQYIFNIKHKNEGLKKAWYMDTTVRYSNLVR